MTLGKLIFWILWISFPLYLGHASVRERGWRRTTGSFAVAIVVGGLTWVIFFYAEQVTL